MRPCPCNGRHRNERAGGRRIQAASRDFSGIHACPRAKPTPPVHANSRKCNARGPPALGLHRSRPRGCVFVDCTAEAQGTLGSLSLLCSALVSSHVRTTPYSSSTCVSVTDGTGPRPDGPAAPPLAPPPLPCSACVRIRTDFEALHQKAEATTTASVFLKLLRPQTQHVVLSVCRSVSHSRARPMQHTSRRAALDSTAPHACVPACLFALHLYHALVLRQQICFR
jgi:hypothetical protein